MDDCSLPGSSVHGILQARVLEWVAISFSTSSHEHNKIKTTCRTTTDEKDWNLPEKIFYNQRHKEGTTTRWVGRVDSQYNQIPYPWVGDPINWRTTILQSFPYIVSSVTYKWLGSSDGKESACNTGDLGLIPEAKRSPGEENGYQLKYSCLENSMDRRAWKITIRNVAKSQIQLSD